MTLVEEPERLVGDMAKVETLLGLDRAYALSKPGSIRCWRRPGSIEESDENRSMRIVIDSEARTLVAGDGPALDLYGREAFELISQWWLKTSWNQKYSYTFTWMGRPIIQHPEDTVRLQELIYFLRPDVVVETGVAHGGSLIFYASLFKAMGRRGRSHRRRSRDPRP